jgi:DNA-binding transcriptional LysR family regulator
MADDDRDAKGAKKISERERHLKLRQIELFLLAAKHETLLAAAKSAGVSTTYMSDVIASLERDLGEDVRLFERDQGGARLTPAGHLLFERGRRLLSEEAAARRDIADLIQDAPTGNRVLRVAYEPLFGGVVRNTAFHLLQSQGDASAGSPRIRVDATEATFPEITQRILEGEVDIGLCARPRRLTDALDNETVAVSPLVLVAGARGVFRSKSICSLEELAGRYFALPSRVPQQRDTAPSLRDVIDDYFHEHGFRPKRVIFEGNTLASVLDMVRTALPVTIAYDIAVHKDVVWLPSQLTPPHDDLVCIPLTPPPNRDLTVLAVRKAQAPPSLDAETFTNALRKANNLELPAGRGHKRLKV